MINKRLVAGKPKIALYVLGIVFLSIILSSAILLAAKFKFLGPMTAVSTQSAQPATPIGKAPSDEYKQQVANEIDKVTTISASLKTADSWLNLELPKMNLVIDLEQ